MIEIAKECSAAYETARACFDSGDDDEVIGLIRTALPSITESEGRFKALLLMACSEWRKGWAKQSLQTLGKASALFDEMSPRLKGRFHGQRAVAHSRLKNHDAAVVDLESAKFWAQVANDQEEIAIARNSLAKQYSNAGRFDEAISEVDAAIEFARHRQDEPLLGQFCDMKAQILVKAKRFEEALRFSERAMSLLESHPALTEARETHGRALIGLGATYLAQDDPIASLSARRRAAELLPTTIDKESLELALERANGNVLSAADDLGVSHSHLLNSIKKHGLPYQARHRARSVVRK